MPAALSHSQSSPVPTPDEAGDGVGWDGVLVPRLQLGELAAGLVAGARTQSGRSGSMRSDHHLAAPPHPVCRPARYLAAVQSTGRADVRTDDDDGVQLC